MHLRLRKFDISSISQDSVVVMIGKRNTGKSFLVRDLLFQHRDIPIGTVISPTESANKFFGHIVPPLFIHDGYKANIIDNVVKRQKLLMRKMDKQTKTMGNSIIDPRSFLLLDDCMYDNTWVKDNNIRLLFMNGRHYKMMFVITMQFPLGIPPSLRTQIDYVFILRENVSNNRKRIYDNFAGMFPTYEVFCQVMDQCTENYECIVIHNGARSNKLEDQVFWYKAENRSNFRIGAQEFWDLSASLCDDRDSSDEDGELYDASAVRKRRGPTVSVKKNN